MSRRSKVLTVLGVLAVAAGVAYYVLIVERHTPEGCAPGPDLKRVRELANSLPGEKPSGVRVERIAKFEMPGAALIAGHSWAKEDMPVYAYQLLFPSQRPIIVDAALDAEQAKAMHGVDFDPQAFERLSHAMSTASAIYVTHEHGDHLGGLVVQTSSSALANARVTTEQLAHPENLDPVVMPPLAKQSLKPFAYEQAVAVAPGVVLVKAPGHTPGSQWVFVQLAGGGELLFLGDTAWHADSVKEAISPPRFVSLFLHNDRDVHTCQLIALRALAAAEPQLIQIPGHDGQVIDGLIAGKLLAAKFE